MIAIVPFGYYFDESDSSHVRMKLASGQGEYATIIRTCNGNLEDVHTGKFSDFGGELAFRPNLNGPIVLGLRGGHLSADSYSQSILGLTINELGPTENGYVNAYIAFEERTAGLSVGWVRNLGVDLDEDRFKLDGDFRSSKDYLSGHFRLGAFDDIYLISSLNEGVPIVSQHGFFLVGVGYGGLKNWHLLSGFSAGFFEAPGIHLGLSRGLGSLGSADLSLRYGTAEGETEHGVSLGWSIPLK